MRMTTLTCTLAAILGCASVAHAALLGYEGFEGYTVGAPIGGQAGTGNVGFAAGSDWTGALHIAQASSLSYTNGGTLVTTGGSIISNQTGGQTNTRPLAAPIATTSTTGGEFWASYLFQGGPVTQDAGIVRFYYGPSGEDGQRIDLNVVRGWPDTTELSVEPAAYFGGGLSARGKFADSDDGTHVNTFLLVLQYVLEDPNVGGGQGVMRAYVNPVIGGAAPDVSSAVASFSGFGGFDNPDTMRLWTPGEGSNAIIRDEIRWGTTFADVTPTIPEPASLAIVALAAAGLVAVRRRK